MGNLHIVNSLLANNDVTYGRYTGTESSHGGAIYIRRANDASTMTAGLSGCLHREQPHREQQGDARRSHPCGERGDSGTITPIYIIPPFGVMNQLVIVYSSSEHMNNCAWDELPTSMPKDGDLKLNEEASHGTVHASQRLQRQRVTKVIHRMPSGIHRLSIY